MIHNDQAIRNFVDQAFAQYDRDRSGCLNYNELVPFMNQVLGLGGYNCRLEQQQILSIARSLDRNRDGSITKNELYAAVPLIFQSQQQYYTNQGGFGQGGFNQGPGFGQGGFNQGPGFGQGGFNQGPGFGGNHRC
jgi:hypothetical protein